MNPLHYELSYLQTLEAESIHIFREVAAERERPVLLFSGGKDSLVLLRLAEKAFRPGRFPFPIMHVDTGHNFTEVIEFRDRLIGELGERLIVASVQDSIDSGRVGRRPAPGPPATASRRRRCWTRSPSIASTPPSAGPVVTRSEHGPRSGCSRSGMTSASGIPSASDRSHGPSTTRGSVQGEHVRVFPLSNWTELDVWQYIAEEKLEVPSIYYAHDRNVFERDGMLYAASPYIELMDGERCSRHRCATARLAT